MADFRKDLYNCCIPQVTSDEAATANQDLTSQWSWYEHRYLPIIQPLSREALILELGCGAGTFLAFLQDKGFINVEGIDLSEEQVRLANHRGLSARVVDVFDYLACVKERFEAIVALDFVEHFTKDELVTLFPQINEALKPGGVLIMQTPNGQGLFPRQVIYDDLTHMTVFTPESLKHLLGLFGFDNITFQETGPVPKDFKGTIRTWMWTLVKVFANSLRRIEANKSQAIWTENLVCYCTKTVAGART